MNPTVPRTVPLSVSGLWSGSFAPPWTSSSRSDGTEAIGPAPAAGRVAVETPQAVALEAPTVELLAASAAPRPPPPPPAPPRAPTQPTPAAPGTPVHARPPEGPADPRAPPGDARPASHADLRSDVSSIAVSPLLTFQPPPRSSRTTIAAIAAAALLLVGTVVVLTLGSAEHSTAAPPASATAPAIETATVAVLPDPGTPAAASSDPAAPATAPSTVTP